MKVPKSWCVWFFPSIMKLPWTVVSRIDPKKYLSRFILTHHYSNLIFFTRPKRSIFWWNENDMICPIYSKKVWLNWFNCHLFHFCSNVVQLMRNKIAFLFFFLFEYEILFSIPMPGCIVLVALQFIRIMNHFSTCINLWFQVLDFSRTKFSQVVPTENAGLQASDLRRAFLFVSFEI